MIKNKRGKLLLFAFAIVSVTMFSTAKLAATFGLGLTVAIGLTKLVTEGTALWTAIRLIGIAYGVAALIAVALATLWFLVRQYGKAKAAAW